MTDRELKKGIESLTAAVLRDCEKDGRGLCDDNCRHKTQKKWILDRSQHYADFLGLSTEEILTAWERERDYWYMNFYQDGNQPPLSGERKNTYIFDDEATARVAISQCKEEKKFRCALCREPTKSPQTCDSGAIVENIKDGKDGPCNWTSYGLFKTGVTLVVKSPFCIYQIFMPIALEAESQEQKQ